jgi:hypothetical protein
MVSWRCSLTRTALRATIHELGRLRGVLDDVSRELRPAAVAP